MRYECAVKKTLARLLQDIKLQVAKYATNTDNIM